MRFKWWPIFLFNIFFVFNFVCEHLCSAHCSTKSHSSVHRVPDFGSCLGFPLGSACSICSRTLSSGKTTSNDDYSKLNGNAKTKNQKQNAILALPFCFIDISMLHTIYIVTEKAKEIAMMKKKTQQ